MGDFGNDFDPSAVEPMGPLLLPAGVYDCVVVEASRERLKSGNGDKLGLKLFVDMGPQKGRWIWDSLNCWHTSDRAKEFALGRLASICRSAGKTQRLSDSSQLVGYRVRVRVEHKPKDDGGLRAEIKEYLFSSTEVAAASPATEDKEPWA